MQKQCPKCQSAHHLDAMWCQCGHHFKTRFVPDDQTQAFGASPVQNTQVFHTPPVAQAYPYAPPMQPQTTPNAALIMGMWVTFVLTFFIGTLAPSLVWAAWLASVIFAIVLVCGKDRVDRINGWICLVINLIMLVFVLFIFSLLASAFGRAAVSQPETYQPPTYQAQDPHPGENLTDTRRRMDQNRQNFFRETPR